MGGRKAGVFIVAGFVLALLSFGPGQAAQFKVRSPVDLGKFTGLWHEIARTPNRFQDNQPRKRGERFSACYDTIAQYALGREGRVLVQNSCLRRSHDGKVIRDTARGVAQPVAGSGNRKFQVAFGPGVARLVQRLLTSSEGNYHIYCLGPVKSGRHSWAVVGDDDKAGNLFLLARNPAVPDRTRSDMAACARSHGLPVNRLISRQSGGGS